MALLHPARHLFIVLICAVTALFSPPARGQAESRPNFLFISIDDLRNSVGFLSEEPGNLLQEIYPDPVKRAAVRAVLTPNLDRLAAEGISFRRAYTPFPLCNPARVAILTGMRPHVSGVFNFSHFRDAKQPVRNVITLPQHLKQAGYFTVGIGKVLHHSTVTLDAQGNITQDGPDSQRSWSRWINHDIKALAGRLVRSPYSNDLGSVDLPASHQSDYVAANYLAQLLQTGTVTYTDHTYRRRRTIKLPRDGTPFFLALGIHRPHTPWHVPQEMLDLFPADDIQLAWTDHLEEQADVADLNFLLGESTPFQQLLARGRRLHGPEHGHIAWKEAVRYYLAAIALADRAVGHVLDGLDQSGHRDNTIVVLWSDHGWHHGEKLRWGKRTLWEESAGSLLLFRLPGQPHGGAASYHPVDLMSLYPTIATLAGAPAPAHVAGADLALLLASPESPWRVPALSTFGETASTTHHAIRHQDYSYIRYANGSQELYHYASDPDERVNLAYQPAYADRVDEMATLLDRMLQDEHAVLQEHLPARYARTSVPPSLLDPLHATPENSHLPALQRAHVTPNPFTHTASFHFHLPEEAYVQVEVFNAMGQRVRVLSPGWHASGDQIVIWDGTTDAGASVAPGVYYFRTVTAKGPLAARAAVVRF